MTEGEFMDDLERLRRECVRHISELEKLKRALEAHYSHLARMPRKRKFKTWMRQAKELREQNRLN